MLLAGCGSRPAGGGSTATATPSSFSYDRSAPLAFRDRGVVNRRYPIKVHDVSYASPSGERVIAYLVLPPEPGRHPAVIYLHGSGENRLKFVLPAAWMAARGAIGLSVDSAFVRSPLQHTTGIAALRETRLRTAETIVDLRRAIDLLQARPDVDPHRIAFVGFSSGAKLGALLAGVEHRIRSYDLMSGGSYPAEVYVRAAPPSLRARVRAELVPTDALRYIGHAAPSTLFFQDGRNDSYAPHAALVGLIRAASRPKRVRWYDAGHDLGDAAYHDQLRWLSRRLGLDGPLVRGAVAGP
jgi:acetyl esterase/lipase